MSDKEMIGSMSLDELELLSKASLKDALKLAYSEGIVIGVEKIKEILDKTRKMDLDK